MNFREISIEKVCGEKDRYKLFFWKSQGNDCFVSATYSDLVDIHKLLSSVIGGEPKPTKELCDQVEKACFGGEPRQPRSSEEVIRRCKELEGANAARQTTIELLCKTIENMGKK